MKAAAVPRPIGTVALLFTDIEGSTAMWEAESAAMRRAVARQLEILDQAVGDSGIRAVEQGAGDSAVVSFARSTDAAAAALTAQARLCAEEWPTQVPLRVRMALHLGEIQVAADGSYSGPTMNRCGRLLATAHGGQVVASGSFVQVAGESAPSDGGFGPGLRWRDLGVHRLRGIHAPMEIHQLEHPDLPSEFPPLRTPQAQNLRLPDAGVPLVGRERELTAIREAVLHRGVVTIIGSGGSGKTRLAAEIAERALEDFDDGVFWVDLAKVSDPAGIEELAVAELHLLQGSPDPGLRLVNHLRDRRCLVVFDNCEHVIDAAAELVARIGAECATPSMLATSREPLELRHEVVWRLGPLSLPTEATTSAVAASEAGELLIERVGRVRPGFTLTEDDAPAAYEICRRLDGIPLAIELAAARTRSLPLQDVAERLGDRFALLAGGGRNVMARQRTLEASVAWSHDLLRPAHQSALMALSTFSGPFDLDAARAVVGPVEGDAVDLVVGLADRSLLSEELDANPARYRMLETVRFFARQRSIDAGEFASSRDRHLDWVLSLVRDAGGRLEGRDAKAAAARIDEDIEEVRAALEWASETDRRDAILTIVTSLSWYWVWRGLAGEALRWMERAGAIDANVDPHLVAEAAWMRFWMATIQNPDHDIIERHAEVALGLARACADRILEGKVLQYLGVHRCFFDPVTYEALVWEGHALCRAAGGPWAVISEGQLALVKQFRGRNDLAMKHLDSMEAAARANGNPQVMAEYLARRCWSARVLGDYDAAVAAKDEMAEVLDGITQRNVSGLALQSVGLIDVERGHSDVVIERSINAIAGYLQDEEGQYVPLVAAALAAALIAIGRPQEALAALQPVWKHPEVRRAIAYGPVLRPWMAAATWMAGDTERARELAIEGIEEGQLLDCQYAIADCEYLLALLDLEAGEPFAAEEKLHSALSAYVEIGHRQHVCDVLEELALLGLDTGRDREAAVLLGAASRERDAQGVVVRIRRQAAWTDTVALTEERLGTDNFTESWQHGAAMPLEDAVALARRGRGERTRPTLGWDSLTDTEQRVAELAAEGLTNPRIAEELIMGRETVKTHMSHILRKLDLANRTELAVALSRRSPA